MRAESLRSRLRWVNAVSAAGLLPAAAVLLWHWTEQRHTLHWTALLLGLLVLGLSLLSLLTSWYLIADGRRRGNPEQDARVDSVVQQMLDLGQRRLDAVLAGTSDLVVLLNAHGRITFASAAGMDVLGYSAAQLRAMTIDELVTDGSGDRLAAAVADLEEGQQTRLDLMAIRGDGRHCPVELTITSQLLEQIVAGYVVGIRDISHLSAVTEELARQSQYDQLTTLPNRRLFNSQLEHLLRTGAPGALGVVVADVDELKSINAAYGTRVGDHLLVELGRRLTELLEAGDVLARVDGDEFAIALRGRSSVGMTATAKRLQAALARPFLIDDLDLTVKVSLGLAQAQPTDSVDDVVRNADVALYWAKERGRGGLARYQQEVHHRSIDALVLRQDLQRAIRTGELTLVFQPLVHLADDVICGVEALARWAHPLRGPVPPSEFIPLAEQAGLMKELGSWVLRQACLAAARMQRPGRPFRMSVNISAAQLAQPEFVLDLLGSLNEAELDPGLLMLEITESAVLTDIDQVIPRLAALRSLGVHVTVDDFGTGYSSLNYLTRLPLDELEIDKSFVERLPGDAATESVVRSTLAMARNLNLITVGEGVETAEQRDWLQAAGCTLGQGYLWAQPLEEHRLIAAIDAQCAVPRQTVGTLSPPRQRQG